MLHAILTIWDKEEIMENVKIIRQDRNRILKDLDLFKVRGHDEISPYVSWSV